ncbi:MAG: ABC transporter ATP-binding protein [Christensenellales bacterium]|jgi:branched-chain amino acid transport system ATP-binding protein
MLIVQKLHVHYGHIHALRGVSLAVKQRQIVSLIGANGAGKTTTLMAISGIQPATSGSVKFEDNEIIDNVGHETARAGLSLVPEGRHVFPKLSVEENLIMGTVANKSIDRKQTIDRMQQMYELFPRMKERQRQAAGTLSGGEQQMLAIARGLMCDPKLIMLDEPSLGLAPIIVDEIFELILKIRDMGKTILLIEQNASLALSISDYAYVMELGQIVLEDTGKELLANPEVKRAYLGI